MLTQEMKEARCRISQGHLDRYAEEGDAFLSRIVTGDESWVHHYDPETKQQSKEYRHPCSSSPKKFRIAYDSIWDCEGIVHLEFVDNRVSINSNRFIEMLKSLQQRLMQVRSDKHVLLHHDNARPHTSQKTRTHIERSKISDILEHPRYSPDLAPSDFYMFPRLKKHPKGTHFDNDGKLKDEVKRWCRHMSCVFYFDGMQQLVNRWRLCVKRGGDYVEF